MFRTRHTMKPGQPGTKKLLSQYGSRLVCVRYRDDDERKTRCKTVELIIEEFPWPSPSLARHAATDIVRIRIRYEERALRTAIRNRGGQWDPSTRTWLLPYADALALRLLERIVTR